MRVVVEFKTSEGVANSAVKGTSDVISPDESKSLLSVTVSTEVSTTVGPCDMTAQTFLRRLD